MDNISTFLMFTGQAEEAMNYYISLFDRSEIVRIQRYGDGEAGYEDGVRGKVSRADFKLNGQLFICMDSFAKHGFTFTPSTSLYATCGTEEEIDLVFDKLSDGGQVLMPLDAYPFSRKFGWVQDRFGVSWQLTLS